MPAAPPDSSLGARILEIGTFPYFANAFPGDTTYLHIGYRREFKTGEGRRLLTFREWPRAMKLLRDGAYDLVIVNPTRVAPWSPVRILRSLFNRHTLRGDFVGFRYFGQLLPLLHGRTPLAVVDFDDPSLLFRHQELLLRHARLYFKRELPVDRWRLFTGRAVNGIPSPRYRADRRRQEMLARLRPLPLGLARSDAPATVPTAREKKVDIFYRGAVTGRSSHRVEGLAELKALASEGITLDIEGDPMPFDAFMARMAEARLVWSPEGLGWDCFRHYEAAAAWSVPLINTPPIERHAPLEDGKHCFLYDVSGGMAPRIREALADPARLERMAADARAHVLATATPEAICRYVVGEMLSATRSSGAPSGET